jgi:glycosyltransferase involved in cell wall biosynthesis
MDCTTILLIYNEEDNIKPLTRDILNTYQKNNIDGEVLLVDDGSYDSSKAVCDELADEFENVRVIHHPKNIGRSYAIQTGFREGNGEVLIIMDGDYQYEPGEIPEFLSKVEEGFDVVSGCRTDRADTPVRRFISRTYNRWLIRGVFNLNIKDQNSGFKAFKNSVAKTMDFNPDGFLGLHRFILPLASLKGNTVTEIPISHYDRPAGSSYIKSYTVPFITLRDYFRFRKQFIKPKKTTGKNTAKKRT